MGGGCGRADAAVVRLKGPSAAALGAALALLASGCGSGGGEAVAHSCSPTDRQFIRDASFNMTSVATLGRDYLAGGADAKAVIAETDRASRVVDRSRPTDPALSRMRNLLGAMFQEYGRAIEAKSTNGDAGPHMYRAYGLAAFASDVLREAEPELSELGCDVTPLL
jgi:hypothetical protein